MINKNYLTNKDQNGISTNLNNNNNINTILLSTYSADDDYLDKDKKILEKGAELGSDFHMQLKQSTLNNNYNYANHHRNKNLINKNKFINNKNENNQINDSNNKGIVGGNPEKISHFQRVIFRQMKKSNK